ncbi:acyl-CoA dehydrogenase C-terminal domain-containing protein, partial [Psychrobacter proteolyticus]|uniref:acyl-CoA dehydrogenase C-terminal domain-containing protein n=1 Tax=Psychrobacter proteolyticus TaxID=147825 RepID=UPI00311FAC6C
FASIVLSWICIRQASKAEQLLCMTQDLEQKNFYKGKIQAAKYFIDWDLPLVNRDIELLTNTNSVCTDRQA